MRKGPTLAVLAGQTDRVAFVHERRKGERLGHGPINAFSGLNRLAAVVEQTPYCAVETKSLRNGCEVQANFDKACAIDACAAAPVFLDTRCRGSQPGPATVEPVGFVGFVGLTCFECGFEVMAPIRLQPSDFSLRNDSFGDKLLGI